MNRTIRIILLILCVWTTVFLLLNLFRQVPNDLLRKYLKKNIPSWPSKDSVTTENTSLALEMYTKTWIKPQDEDSCKPKVNVTFVKLHKTSSSSIQNIFLRYALKYNYTVLLPYDGYFGHPEVFHRNMAPMLKRGLVYNILCHHLRWNFEEIRKVMPPNTVYVTIMREPVRVFESLYYYTNLKSLFKMNIEQYALTNKIYSHHHNRRLKGCFGRNQMAFDLGMNTKEFENKAAIEDFIYTVARQFDFVMIVEKLYESLILLKHLLCWSMEDVIVFRHNSRIQSTKVVLDNNIVGHLHKWNNVDKALYDYFLQRLNENIEHFGQTRMAKEVKELKKMINDEYNRCISRKAIANRIPKDFRPYHKKTYGYVLKQEARNDSTCRNLIMSENPFSDTIRKRQANYYTLQSIFYYYYPHLYTTPSIDNDWLNDKS